MGKQSQALSGIEESKIRWLKDDVITFLQREVKRGSRYDAIIMDPPAFGRGPDGETFVIEDDLSAVIQLCGRIVSKNPLFIILNQYPKNIPLEYCELLLRERFANMQLSKKKLNLVCNQDNRQIHCATGITLVPISKKKHG
jgi:23S rRNA G2069 N7-methylase RlmK/C1962 C5-methylase RlmI